MTYIFFGSGGRTVESNRTVLSRCVDNPNNPKPTSNFQSKMKQEFTVGCKIKNRNNMADAKK